MKKYSFLLSTLIMTACTEKAQVVIDVDAMQQGPEISPVHYGLFYEDINHAADGGLYASTNSLTLKSRTDILLSRYAGHL